MKQMFARAAVVAIAMAALTGCPAEEKKPESTASAAPVASEAPASGAATGGEASGAMKTEGASGATETKADEKASPEKK